MQNYGITVAFYIGVYFSLLLQAVAMQFPTVKNNKTINPIVKGDMRVVLYGQLIGLIAVMCLTYFGYTDAKLLAMSGVSNLHLYIGAATLCLTVYWWLIFGFYFVPDKEVIEPDEFTHTSFRGSSINNVRDQCTLYYANKLNQKGVALIGLIVVIFIAVVIIGIIVSNNNSGNTICIGGYLHQFDINLSTRQILDSHGAGIPCK